MKKRMIYTVAAFTMVGGLVLTGCGGSDSNAGNVENVEINDSSNGSESETAEKVIIDTDDMFTERDLAGDYDASEAVGIRLADDKSEADSDNVDINGNTITIKAEGVYILSGTLSDGMIVVDAGDSDKIQLVLDNVSVTNSSSAALYVKKSNKVFVTLAKDSDNSLINSEEFAAIDDNNIDGAVFAKDDITFNGTGKLNVTSEAGHGIVAKDDLVIASGYYNIASASESHGIQAKDSVGVAGGTIEIHAGKDGIHSENSDDTSKGYVYIQNGEFAIEAGSDGISAGTTLQIDGGSVNVSTCKEGLEARDIIINDGNINITATDDGINASDGSGSGGMGGMPNGDMPDMENMPERPEGAPPARPDRDGSNDNDSDTSDNESGERPERPEGMPPGGHFTGEIQDVSLTINGGTVTIDAEGDGLDSNGILTINGGTVYVFGPTRGGNGAIDYAEDAVVNGGTVVAAGDSSMAEGFTENSTQAFISTGVDEQSEGGTIILKDSSGKELLNVTTSKRYDSVVVSTPDMKKGETYTLVTGDAEKEISAD